MTMNNTCSDCGVAVGQPHTNECQVRHPSAEKSIADRYWDWCCDRDRFDKLGKYGPEFRLRIDVPLDEIVELMREAGVEPTFERIEGVLFDLQANHFDDKHGGCPTDDVKGYIRDTANNVIESWEEQGLYEEFYPIGDEADDEGATNTASESP